MQKLIQKCGKDLERKKSWKKLGASTPIVTLFKSVCSCIVFKHVIMYFCPAKKLKFEVWMGVSSDHNPLTPIYHTLHLTKCAIFQECEYPPPTPTGETRRTCLDS